MNSSKTPLPGPHDCKPLQWRHNGHNGVSHHQPHHCLLNNYSGRHRSKKTSKLCDTGLCAGNSPVTVEFPAQRASNAENVFNWWRRHAARAVIVTTPLHKWASRRNKWSATRAFVEELIWITTKKTPRSALVVLCQGNLAAVGMTSMSHVW